MLTAEHDAVIRYTLDGSTPTAGSPVYAGPLDLPGAGAVLKARAYHLDWTESAVQEQTYTVDTIAPTIVAQRFPLPIGDWHRTPVTVSFLCSDNTGVASCSSPTTFSVEGAAQTVTGTAIDEVGLQTTIEETVNVDLTPPALTLTAPVDGLVTTSTSVVVTGEVYDALSGVAVVNCNGIATPVVDGTVSCTVALRPGRNSVTLSARDVAGHSTSAGVTVTLAGTPTRLTLTPAARTMLVNETDTLSLRDDFGVPAPGAAWSSSNPAVVALSMDDPPVLTALAEGVATVQAIRDGLSSVSTIYVVSGTSLPDGTTRWTVPPTPSPNTSWFEAPIYTHRIDASGPDVFMVETNMTTWERTLRALSASGEVDWLITAPGVPLMGDTLGGVVAGVEPSLHRCGLFDKTQRCYTALARFAGPAGTEDWRYESPGLVDRPAQGPDGTIYVVEHVGNWVYYDNNPGIHVIGEKAVVILNGATGEVTARVPLASESSTEPTTVGPIVAGDGFGYILVASGKTITLLGLSREGQWAEEEIVHSPCSASSCRPVPYQLVPDGIGGLLIVADWRSVPMLVDVHVTRLDGQGGRVDTAVHGSTRIEMIGQGGTAYLRTTSGAQTVSQPVVDVATWTPLWSLPLEWSLRAASPDRGAVAQNAAGDLALFDGTGQLAWTAPPLGLRNPVQEFGSWVGNSTYGFRAVAGSFDDATRWDATDAEVLWSGQERYGFGDRQRNLQMRRPGQGIFLKSHGAQLDAVQVEHTSVRITPFNQRWLADTPDLIGGTDAFSNLFFTLGAGPDGADSSLTCNGTLTKGTNREGDVLATTHKLVALPVPWATEAATIFNLLSTHGAYQDSLPYGCFPEISEGFYNSNSYLHGLLHAAGVSHSERPPLPLTPGWWTPVPLVYFALQ